MKVGIIGGGPLAIEMSLQLTTLGAGVSIFSPSLGGKVRLFGEEKQLLGSSGKMAGPWSEITTAVGRKTLLDQSGKSNDHLFDHGLVPSIDEYWEKYLKPLSKFVQKNIIHNDGKVLRVHKRFLSLDEEIDGRTRLLDLFRVVYLKAPDEESFSEKSLDKKTLDSLGNDVINSLKNPMEQFDDFDIIVDATGVLGNPSQMGPSSTLALNEKNPSLKEQVFYGVENFKNLLPLRESVKKLTIVGSGESSGKFLLNIKDLIEKESIKVSLVTTEENPFQEELENGKKDLFLKELDQFLKERQIAFENKRVTFEKSLREWRDLEDYMKAKVPRPKEPSKNPSFFCGFNVTAVDKLIDREEVFVTIENAPFRGSSNNVKTIPCDKVAVLTGYQCSHYLFEGLKADFTPSKKQALSNNGLHPHEPGFYTLGPVNDTQNQDSNSQSIQRYELNDGLHQIEVIVDNILSFFTKVED